MKKLSISLLLLGAILTLSEAAMAEVRSCTCEHFGSVYDQICEARPIRQNREWYWNVTNGYVDQTPPPAPDHPIVHVHCTAGQCRVEVDVYRKRCPDANGNCRAPVYLETVQCIGGTGMGPF